MKPSVTLGGCFVGLTVEAKLPSVGGRAMWLCRCGCGGSREVSSKMLTTGRTTHCTNCQDSGSKSPLSVRLQKWKLSSAGCWEWTGRTNELGYGRLIVDGKETRAHRAMYFMLHPDADRSLVVMHKCDNPRCVNPDHLQLGTVKDNVKDMHRKGRFRGGAPTGNKNAVGNKGWQKGGATAKYVTLKLGDEVDVPDELLCTP